MKLLLPIVAILIAACLAGCSPTRKIERHLEKAITYEQDGQTEEAIAEYLNVVRVQSMHPEAVRRLAHLYYEAGPPQSAFMFLDRAVAIDPADLDTRLKLATFCTTARQIRAARTHVDALLEQQPGHPQALMLLGQIAEPGEDLDDALRQLDAATLPPDDQDDFLVAKGMAWLRANHADKARAPLEEVLSRDPTRRDAHLGLGLLELAVGNSEAAEEHYRLAADQTPPDSPTRLRYAALKVQNGDIDGARTILSDVLEAAPDSLGALYQLTLIDPALAIEPLEGVSAAQPGNPQILSLLGAAYRATDRDEDAVEVYRRLAELQPDRPGHRFRLGAVQLDLGNRDDAIQTFENALDTDARYLPPLQALVSIDLGLGDPTNAMRRVTEVLESEPDYAGAQMLMAELLVRQNDHPGAIAVLKRTIALDSPPAEAYRMLANVQAASGDLPAAIEEMTRAVETHPDALSARLLLAVLLEQNGDSDGAAAQYQGILETHPDNGAAANNLAYLYAQNPDTVDQAYELARDSQARFPTNPHLADTLGWILHLRGDDAEALTLLSQSAEALPTQPEIAYHLGSVYHALGRNDDARRAFQRAADAGTPFPGSENVARLLEELAPDADAAEADR